ncbi:MAG: YceI family protein [Pyrinomonadaceae bacterium]
MKRTVLIFVLALISLVALSQSGAEAVGVTFADRFAAASPIGETGTYNFDKNHSVIGFKVKHNGLIEIPGYFRDFTGTINYDAKDVAKSTVEFTAKVASVDTGVGGRDNHLKTADFFDAANHPDITFKSTRVEQKGKDWMLTGDFTLRGVTKSLTFPFNISGFLPATERGTGRMGIVAETKINRRDFGVNYGVDAVVSDQIGIVIQVEAPMKRDAPAKPAQ